MYSFLVESSLSCRLITMIQFGTLLSPHKISPIHFYPSAWDPLICLLSLCLSLLAHFMGWYNTWLLCLAFSIACKGVILLVKCGDCVPRSPAPRLDISPSLFGPVQYSVPRRWQEQFQDTELVPRAAYVAGWGRGKQSALWGKKTELG